MLSSYIIDKIKYTTEIMDYMDKHLTLKYKDLIRGVEQDLLFSQRNVERYLRTSTGFTPMFYYERRKLTEAIIEIIENPNKIRSICKKYKYINKKELNRKCEVYFNTSLEDIIKNKDIYKLQEKVSEEEMLQIHMRAADVIQSMKLTKIADVKRSENTYKIKLTLDRMPIYMLPELKYNAIRDGFNDGKFDKRGFLLRIAIIDKSIKENTNSIRFDKRETEIINCCHIAYSLLEPINIDGICYIGIDKKITYRYLEKIGVINRFGLTKTDVVKQIKVRYLGNSGAIPLDDDKLSYHFFTKDMNLDLAECPVDFYIDLKESEVRNIVDRVYEKRKYNPIELDGIPDVKLSDEIIEGLDRKINNFRYGEIITVSTFNNTIVAINDFYPRVKIITGEEILGLIELLINKIENMKNNNFKIDENIMASGYEVMNKIIRFSKTQPNQSISNFVESNFDLIDSLEDLFVDLSYIYVGYINAKLNEKEVCQESLKIFKNMSTYIDIMKKLYNIIKGNIEY